MVRVQGLSSGSVEGAFAPRLRKLRRFTRTPKGYLTLALALLAVVAAPGSGLVAGAGMLFWAVAGAAGMELLLVGFSEGTWRFPSSALLTGLIVGLILGPQEPWYTAAVAGIVAIDAKFLLRLGRRHVFNPAALGLLAVYLLFGTGQSWWGALPSLPMPAIALLLVIGYLVADRANKLPAALVFLGSYLALFTVATVVGGAGAATSLNEIYRTPLLNAMLFFGFFMVTDPPTSPVQFGEQAVFGGAVALATFIIYMATRGLYYLPLGLLAVNAGYALWRVVLKPRLGNSTGTEARRQVA